MPEAMPFIINLLIPPILFISWLVAEYRCRAHIRIALGMACLLFPALWIWAAIYSSHMIGDMHYFGLHRIENMVQEGRELQAQRALRAYNETYQETQSAKAAVFRMNAVLMELDPDGKRNKTTEDRKADTPILKPKSKP
jgi:hypothetical protein